MLSICEAISRAWDAVQVELQGRYSMARLQELLHYLDHSSLLHAVLIIFLTPVPCLVAVIAMETLPLNKPTSRIAELTFGFWFRSFFLCWIMAFMITMQICQTTPSLPMTRTRHWTISLAISGALMGTGYMYLKLVGCPMPFSLQVQTLPWLIMLSLSLLWSWRETLRTDPQARYNLKRYAEVFGAQVVIILVYTSYNCVYAKFSARTQTLLAFLLPFIKLAFKNWVSRGMFHLEDLAPTSTVFNVDVFHSLFVSSTMQQATTRLTVVAVMVVDLVQSLIAYYEVHRLLKRAKRLAVLGQEMEANDSTTIKTTAVSDQATHRVGLKRDQTGITLQMGAVDYALHILETRPQIREHPDIAYPRHLRRSRRGTNASMRINTVRPGLSVQEEPSTSTVEKQQQQQSPRSRLSRRERTQLESAQCVLKLLHMAEFYVLIEFIEVIVAVVYSTYLLAMTQLPNRVYNMQLNQLSDDQLLATVQRGATFALLELLSFLLFCGVLDRELQHFSSVRLLGFVLRKHWVIAQATLVMWVVFVAQIPLEHLGTDYTFQFKWLRHHNHTNDTLIQVPSL